MHTLADELMMQRRHLAIVQEKAQQHIKLLAEELISRIGAEVYEYWVDTAITDDDVPTDIEWKMRTKLEALDLRDAHKDEVSA